MTITHLYEDPAGVSHFRSVAIPLQSQGAIGSLSRLHPAKGVLFRSTEETYDYDWHRAPRRQWIVLLNGEIEIEVGDGERRRFRGGDILLVEDISGRGHRTRQLSPGIRHSLFLPIPDGQSALPFSP